MILRLLLIALVVLGVIYLLRNILPRIRQDPRLNYWVFGVGRNLLFLYLIQRGLPYLLRALGAIRFFR